MSMSGWRRRRRAIEKYDRMSDIREMIFSTGIFHERSTGRYYCGEKIRVRIVPTNRNQQKGYVAIWEVLKLGEAYSRKWWQNRGFKVMKEDWFEVTLEELLSTHLDKDTAKLFLFNLDVFLELE